MDIRGSLAQIFVARSTYAKFGLNPNCIYALQVAHPAILDEIKTFEKFVQTAKESPEGVSSKQREISV